MSTSITAVRLPAESITEPQLVQAVQQIMAQVLAESRDHQLTETVLKMQYDDLLSTGTAAAGHRYLGRSLERFRADLEDRFATDTCTAFHCEQDGVHYVVFSTWRLSGDVKAAALAWLPGAEDYSYHNSTDDQVAEIGEEAWRARRDRWDDLIGADGYLPARLDRIEVSLDQAPDPALRKATGQMIEGAQTQALCDMVRLRPEQNRRLELGGVMRFATSLTRAVTDCVRRGSVPLPAPSHHQATAIVPDRLAQIRETIEPLVEDAYQESLS